MKEGCSCLFLLALMFVGWQFLPPETQYIVYAAIGVGVLSAILQIATNGLPETKADPLRPSAPPSPPAMVPPPLQPMTREQLRRRFRKELREGIIDQDEYDSLRDIYDF